MAEETKPKKKRNTKPPTAKQLRARARFVKMVKARARAAKAAKRAAGIKSKPKTRTTRTPARKATARRPAANPGTAIKRGWHQGHHGTLYEMATGRKYVFYSNNRAHVFNLGSERGAALRQITRAKTNPKKRNIAGFMRDGIFHPIRSGTTPSGLPSKKPYSPKKVGEKSAYSTKAGARSRAAQKRTLKSQRSLTAGTSLKARAVGRANPHSPEQAAYYRAKVEKRLEALIKTQLPATQEILRIQKARYVQMKSAGIKGAELENQKRFIRMAVKDVVSVKKEIAAHKKARAKKNPGIATARKQYKEFTGRPSRKVSTNYAPKGSKAPKSVAAMGKLKKVFVKGRAPLNFSAANATLARSGNKMFVLGKGYTLSHVKGRRRNPDGFEDLGEITRLEYEATKTHLGDAQPVTYFHKMGEEGGARPHAVVNDEGLLIIDGGSQYIDQAGIHD